MSPILDDGNWEQEPGSERTCDDCQTPSAPDNPIYVAGPNSYGDHDQAYCFNCLQRDLNPSRPFGPDAPDEDGLVRDDSYWSSIDQASAISRSPILKRKK